MLVTSDADAAQDFYGKVIGWTAQGSGMPGMDYRFFSSGDGSDNQDGVGGFMAITAEMAEHGAVPCWLGYIAADDVDFQRTRLRERLQRQQHQQRRQRAAEGQAAAESHHGLSDSISERSGWQTGSPIRRRPG